MHWAYEVALELIRKHPNKETFVCASGISPSGSVHIGNFREIVTTYFVVRALQDLGKRLVLYFHGMITTGLEKSLKISILICKVYRNAIL